MAGQQCGLILWLRPGLYYLFLMKSFHIPITNNTAMNATPKYPIISIFFITLILYEINYPNPTKSKNKFTRYTYKIELKPKYCP